MTSAHQLNMVDSIQPKMLKILFFLAIDYMCGSSANWSSVYTMRTLGSGADYSPVFLVYGDFGYDNAQSMSRIQAEVSAGGIDAILHVGDLAYDMFEDEGRKGDNFMNMIQSVSTQIPYMTLPGNHEYYK